ncbi:hypothetical protein BY996DRAFT_6612576 [Phakopsora pachyrhizi]|nr:hypothetical protein BY996DRAFT_6612576 [Phakopsora pachyrhizi]
MRERLKKKGRKGKVEAFVKGLNRGSFDVVNYDNLWLQIWSWPLNGGDTQVEELSTNLEAEGKEYEDPEEQISNGLHER